MQESRPNPQLLLNLELSLEPFRDHILFAYLFGSAAKGETQGGSDLDFAFFFADADPQSHHRLRIDLYMAMNRNLKQNDLDIVVLNTASNLMLVEDIVRNGVVLLDADPQSREEYEVRMLHRAMDFKQQRKAVLGV
jgi:uncharacterized protein